jgi:hypothetical protein
VYTVSLEGVRTNDGDIEPSRIKFIGKTTNLQSKLVKFSKVVFACRFYAGGRVESARHGAAQPRHLSADAGRCHVQVQVNIS